MNTPNGYNSCEQVRSYYDYYKIPEAAMLWCGVPPDELEKHLEHARPTCDTNEYGRHVLTHPYIPCLEPRCRAIQDAINSDKLKVGRDGGVSFYTNGESVAYSRRTLKRNDLKEWIAKEFPNDKPAFLFDEVERGTHTAISLESYKLLEIDKKAADTRLRKAEIWAKENIVERDNLLAEIAELKSCVEKITLSPELGERAETTYLNIIGGLLGLMLGSSPSGVKQSVYLNQAAIISALLGHYNDKPGISTRTLEEKFSSANKSLKQY